MAALDAETPSTPAHDLASSAPQAASEHRAGKRHIVFGIAGTRYALEMGQVIEVGPVPPTTPLPQVPPWLLGVSNLRGEVLALLDLRLFLGQPPQAANDRDRMLILQAGSAQLTAGLVVDQVFGVAALDDDRPPLQLAASAVSSRFGGPRVHV